VGSGVRQSDAVHRDQDVEAIVQRFYDLMRTGGSPAHLLSPQLTVAVGTDDEEWWDDYGALITAYVTQFAAMGRCTVHASSPRGYSQGDIGWFEDRPLFTLRHGESVPVRFTGVVRRENGTWRAVQTHVSIGTPNPELNLDLPT